MLRVYGITYDHTVNYGSCFQAYALQKTIESEQLPDGSKCNYQIIPIKTFKEWPIKSRFKHILLYPFMQLHHISFSRFEKEHLRFASIHSLVDLPSLNNTADAFVCGSDVIWNPDLNANWNAFYLDFAEKYKFSYAASFGKAEIDNQTLKKIREPLTALNSISVREKTAADIIERHFDKQVRIVTDPVLLLERKDWETILPVAHTKEKYIFVYSTHLNSLFREFLDNIKTKTGLKIIYAAAGPKQALKQGMLQVQTPEKWLQLLHDAEYVVTNSFHATAFSVLFHKKFFTVVNGDKEKGINVRMNDFLTAIGLPDRIFSDIPSELDLSDIDYTEVDYTIDAMRRKSIDFLRQNLEAAYQRTLLSNGLPVSTISITDTGKPYFPDSDMFFSLSHSHGVCAVAVADRPVGVDVEMLKMSYNPHLVERSLSENEKAVYDGDFTRFWCRKEAVAKMTGEGITGYPNNIDTTEYQFNEQLLEYGGQKYWLVAVRGLPQFVK